MINSHGSIFQEEMNPRNDRARDPLCQDLINLRELVELNCSLKLLTTFFGPFIISEFDIKLQKKL